MEAAADRYSYVLAQPIVETAGEPENDTETYKRNRGKSKMPCSSEKGDACEPSYKSTLNLNPLALLGLTSQHQG